MKTLIQRISILSLVLLMISFKMQATTIIVQVADFSFTPANFMVNVGDTVKWQWVSGSHTTTSNGVPTGAFTWNASISAATPTFSYPVTQIGFYLFHCVPHASQMTGTFQAQIGTGVQTINPFANTFSVLTNPVKDHFTINLNLIAASNVRLSLYDLMGKEISVLANENMPSGNYTPTYYMDEKLQKGYYFLVAKIGDLSVTKKIVVE